MDRVARRQAMREDVALMRELGVLRWGAVWLGPPPTDSKAAVELSPEEAKRRLLEHEQRRHDTLFAASSVKPRLRAPADQKAEEDAARLSRVVNRVPPEVIGHERADAVPKQGA